MLLEYLRLYIKEINVLNSVTKRKVETISVFAIVIICGNVYKLYAIIYTDSLTFVEESYLSQETEFWKVVGAVSKPH